MTLATSLLPLLLALTPVDDEAVPPAAAPVAADPWHAWELENGVRVIAVEAPLAESQAFFTLLPLGLLDDEADRAQFAHLVEHLVVRATDPDELAREDVVVNGETTALALRLEAIAQTENWRTALGRHVEWLQVDDVDPEILGREKEHIAQEEEITAQRGFTHKWALAAWNQVVRHGSEHVAVHGDVAGASVEDAEDTLARRVRCGRGTLVVSVGPVPVDEVRAAIDETIGALPGQPWVASAPTVPPDEVGARRDQAATWDLPARHYLEWFPVPDGSALDRIRADALAYLLNVRLSQRGALAAMGVEATAQADLVTPEGRWLLISASLPQGVDAGAVRAELESLRAEVGAGQEPRWVVQRLQLEMTSLPDFAAIRAQAGDDPAALWLEAQIVLGRVYGQLNMGMDRAELEHAYPGLDATDLISFGDAVLLDGRRSSLLLEPAR